MLNFKRRKTAALLALVSMLGGKSPMSKALEVTKNPGVTKTLTAEKNAVLNGKKKIVIDKLAPLVVNQEGRYKFGNRVFTIKKYRDDELFIFPSSTANFAYIDLSKNPFPLIIRTRKDGDIITPFGMKGTMKLKKYMNGKGVSKHKRDAIPLLCNDTEVLWVAGVGLNDKVGVKDKPTHVIEVEQG